MKKVVLFSPKPSDFTFYGGAPLALLGLARYLAQDKSYDIKIIKATPKYDYMSRLIEEAKDALCVGISSMTGHQIKEGLRLSKEMKKRYPQVPTVWGGWQSTILPEETLKDPNVDIIVIGQGERTFEELVRALEKGKDLSTVRGIWYKENGKIMRNAPRPFESVNSFPRLPYEIIDDIEDSIKPTELGTRTLNYISSIGCPFRCSFCAEKMVSNRKWFGLDSERVLDDIEDLVKRYKINGLYISDSNFFVDRKRVEAICQGLIDRGIKLRLGRVNGRPDQLARFSEETWTLLEKSGFHSILIGSESHSQEMLDIIHKDATVDDTLKLMKICDRHNINLVYSFMIGLPLPGGLEKSRKFVKEDFRKTVDMINLINRNSDNYTVLLFTYTPYPGTELYDLSVDYGIKVPANLLAWGDFNLFNNNTPWVPKKYVDLVNQLSISILPYLPRARKRDKLFAKLLHLIGTIRMRYHFFSLPIEYWMMTQYINHSDFKKKRWDI